MAFIELDYQKGEESLRSNILVQGCWMIAVASGILPLGLTDQGQDCVQNDRTVYGYKYKTQLMSLFTPDPSIQPEHLRA
jgi:hypothetical protein